MLKDKAQAILKIAVDTAGKQKDGIVTESFTSEGIHFTVKIFHNKLQIIGRSKTQRSQFTVWGKTMKEMYDNLLNDDYVLVKTA